MAFKSTLAVFLTKALRDAGLDASFDGETIMGKEILVEESPESIAKRLSTMDERIERMKAGPRGPLKIHVITEQTARGEQVIRRGHARSKRS